MKKLLLIFCILGIGKIALAQWNSGSGITYTSDNVGIGTASPGTKLNVVENASYTGILRLQNLNSSGYSNIQFYDNGGTFKSSFGWINPGVAGIGGVTYMDLNTGNLSIDNGNVGIGTISPTEKLSVNGKIRAKEIKVETGWSDFVFDPSYKLRGLKETEEFIKENKHLPGIPSAKEVADNGINLGEMNAKLLQKIEELTLYLIDQDKKFNTQISDLKKEINQLKSKP